MARGTFIINDVTGLNPVSVWACVKPTNVEEVCEAIRRAEGPISIGGGHFSMGGQTASESSLHMDMRKLNRVMRFEPEKRIIRVQSGARWCDIQRFVDPHNLAVKTMQTYANFTVGGSLSVNCHGRYVGLGPVILAVKSIAVVLLDGRIVEASPDRERDLFYGVIGGYGGLGVIVEAELELAENKRVERTDKKMPVSDYLQHFRKTVRHSSQAVFHNADIYPPKYENVRSVTWFETEKPATTPRRLQRIHRAHPLAAYFMWTITELPFGKWRRQYILDPLIYTKKKIHWRNYEAGYDVAELEPPSRDRRTYVLQEYFVPVARFDEFVPKIREILRRHKVNMVNISIRHALADPGSKLAWAQEEVFAFVLYYKQWVRESAKQHVAVWTRELIDAALSVGGTYYLPYQAHATAEQFHAAYPGAREIFALKAKYDPDCRLRNILWDSYYLPTIQQEEKVALSNTEFHQVYSNIKWRDAFFHFLQTVFRLQPEDKFHALIKDACDKYEDDESIYRAIQEALPGIKPALSDLTYGIPALRKQKREMMGQTLELLGDYKSINGYVEIGSSGRYISVLRKKLSVSGRLSLVDDRAPGYSPPDILERGRIRKLGHFIPLNDYAPIGEDDIPDASADLVTCYIGLHHIVPERLDAFVQSITRILRPGGMFILRDHDAPNPEMDNFVSLVHTVFNAGTGVSWEENVAESRYFNALDHWVAALEKAGLRDKRHRLLQKNDPSANTLMAFVKEPAL